MTNTIRTIGAVTLCTSLWISCTKQEAKSATDAVLSAADIACVATSDLTDDAAVAEACRIVESPLLRSVVHQLIGQREAGRRAGFYWDADGGATSEPGPSISDAAAE